ncbi:MAG TPA: SDR family oxidoreductase [Reyranella sp.]|jgi:3-oxoacyl-[acyl-carrier protein] reductase|nr:SDR family oxidoreductase [Reyranella sp.]
MAGAKRTTLITGAGKNIGRACAHALSEEGFNVAINGSSDRAACERVARECEKLGARALVVMGDVGKLEECKRIFAEVTKGLGPIDALLNNAALRPSKPFLETTEEEWQRVISVDLEGAIRLSRLCLPGMVERGWGRIVNFAGMNAIHGHAGRVHVSVAKHGVWGLTKSLAMEFGPKGITTNVISPGPIAPDAEEHNASVHARAQALAKVPMGRMGKPAEVAAAARLLVSEAGGYINGQMIAVNGGGAT